ncbi:Cell division and transport-associated protein TolR [Tistlia consotensis]|uniref:Cell division and transport-associated protein TolR n=1 Tax=Tistlia consotensis USBA 355 TaxID=560819 RepID=A0A1Y6C2N7_9PROT|nr:protein TolR [Tistlia consotensis]SMF32694.1 Cell division and transport-associated protein TolR [Tistlia consotensis USBA 355]SNR68826.1 Cell division and transport-associated protein TolR [Tistlia consotensis]
MAGPIMHRRGERGWGARRRRWQPMSDINVTPFVDVMLVLLIVFMVTAPLLTVGVQVDLPKAKAPVIPDPVEPLVISVRADGSIFIEDARVDEDTLVPKLRAITNNKPDTRIYVRGDQRLQYGTIMQIMGLVNLAGFTHVALITEMPTPKQAAPSGQQPPRSPSKPPAQ